jgi:flagellar export protein FliJ
MCWTNETGDTMSTQPRQCWSVLVQKATRDKTAAQLAMTQAQAQLERLQANAQRIETMMDDYRTQHESVQGQSHAIADSLNYRRFIDQLETLRERVQRDVTAAATQRERLRQVLLGLEMELKKLAKLQEQDALTEQQLQNKREQNRMDEWGVMRYQFGKQAG